MKTCYIFGALDCSVPDFTPQENDLIIAADGGYSTLKKLNIKPDLVVGDFDSLGNVPENEHIIKHPVKKDDTDTLLAVKIGLEKGYKNFRLYTDEYAKDAHKLYSSRGLIKELYDNPDDKDLYIEADIYIYSKSLTDSPVSLWNNKNIGIKEQSEKEH